VISSPEAPDQGFDLREQFLRLYEHYANDVLRVSYFYLGDRQQAEDVCQDVFVRLLTKGPEIQPGHEKAWLLKVALNRCRDLWRAAWVKRVVLGSPFESFPASDDITEYTEKSELMETVHMLSPAFKEVVLMHYYQGYGIVEIAAMLGLPEGTISSRLSRARKKLESMLKGEEAQ
jgi:RNA polymerase sigma-70 factor (ECF subfamily)